MELFSIRIQRTFQLVSTVTEKARTNPFDYNELKPMDRQLKDLLV